MTSLAPYAEVIGDPIAHSKSPLIHGFWLERLGMKGEYRRTQVRRDELPAYLAARRSDSLWRGCNVTMPLKLDALMLADEKSDTAVQAGACNLLAPREGKLVAGNTDVGAVMLVCARLAETRPTASVTLLGTGGAARAVLVALRRMGLRNVVIQARNRAEAMNLAVQFQLTEAPQPLGAPIRSEGLINATPLGMAGAQPLEVDLSFMPATGWVFDLVTAPNPTPLVVAAERRGLAASGGLPMLVEQAAAAFPLFFGVDPPRSADEDSELYRRLSA